MRRIQEIAKPLASPSPDVDPNGGGRGADPERPESAAPGEGVGVVGADQAPVRIQQNRPERQAVRPEQANAPVARGASGV